MAISRKLKLVLGHFSGVSVKWCMWKDGHEWRQEAARLGVPILQKGGYNLVFKFVCMDGVAHDLADILLLQ